MVNKIIPRGLAALLTCAIVLVSGCASVPNPNPDDPLERYNRAMFSFNDNVDKAVLKPAAQAYEAVVPRLVRTGVGNVLGNIGDVWVGLNNLMQGKVGDGMSDLMRVSLNSTFGILGIFDVASEAGLPKHDEDFGQTLAVWGVDEGPYFVVPLLGPRTVRDAAALPADFYANATVLGIDHVPTRNTVRGVRLVHGRSTVLSAERTIDEASIDKYAFVRDAYLQQRRYKVHDGNPPIDYENFDLDEKSSGSVLYETDADILAMASVRRMEFVPDTSVHHEPVGPVVRSF